MRMTVFPLRTDVVFSLHHRLIPQLRKSYQIHKHLMKAPSRVTNLRKCPLPHLHQFGLQRVNFYKAS